VARPTGCVIGSAGRKDSLSLELYRVDDMNGTINGSAPTGGATPRRRHARLFHVQAARRSRNPGYGGYTQTEMPA